MAKEAIIRQDTADYNSAVQTIKEAILRSQYKAAKLVNREMLSLYYGIGRYISANSREVFWGTGAIKTISERLRKELPGLKGFSQTNLKYMRIFMRNGHLLSKPRTLNRQPWLTKLTQTLFCLLNRQPRLTIWKNSQFKLQPPYYNLGRRKEY